MSCNILVIKLGALGDLFNAMDAFEAIRAHHAADRITLLTRSAFVKFSNDMPWFDEVIVDPTPRGLRFAAWMSVRKTLINRYYARVYDFQCNRRTGIYHWLLGPGRRPEWVGNARGCSHPWHEYHAVNLPDSENHLLMIESAGVPRCPAPADLSWLNAPLDGLPALPEDFVLLVPGCAPHRLEKRWPAARYAELARLLAERRGIGSVVVGTASDHAAIEELCAAAPHVVNLCGLTSLKQLGAVARRAVGVVGNDTGPIHITAAVGAPTLVVMSGHSDPVRMRPKGPNVHVLREADLTGLDAERVFAALRLRAD